VIIIATPTHANALVRELQSERTYSAARRQGHVLVLDAQTALTHIMVDGVPDWGRFDSGIGGPVREMRERVCRGVRMFGEMVGLLWKMHQHSAATRLEAHWNALLRDRSSHLFCAYPIDVFSPDFEIHRIDSLLCSHSRLVSPDDGLEIAVRRAMDEVLGVKAEGLEILIESLDRPNWAMVPKAEGMILWLKNILPDDAEEILTRARRYCRGPGCETLGSRGGSNGGARRPSPNEYR
jgi:hypothetical protein